MTAANLTSLRRMAHQGAEVPLHQKCPTLLQIPLIEGLGPAPSGIAAEKLAGVGPDLRRPVGHLGVAFGAGEMGSQIAGHLLSLLSSSRISSA